MGSPDSSIEHQVVAGWSGDAGFDQRWPHYSPSGQELFGSLCVEGEWARDIATLDEGRDREAEGMRQENIVKWTASAESLALYPGMATNSADSAVRIRAITAWSSMVRDYAQATGFPKEAYCR